MRHKRQKKYLGRNPSHRKAMLSNLVTSLIENGRIHTTEAKAKEGRRLAERLITFARKGDLHSRRQVLKIIRDKRVVKRLFDEIAPRFSDRKGGYTRIVKLGTRLGDRASLVLFEVLGEPVAAETKNIKKTKGAKKVVREAVQKVKGKKSIKKKESQMTSAETSLEKEGKTKKDIARADVD